MIVTYHFPVHIDCKYSREHPYNRYCNSKHLIYELSQSYVVNWSWKWNAAQCRFLFPAEITRKKWVSMERQTSSTIRVLYSVYLQRIRKIRDRRRFYNRWYNEVVLRIIIRSWFFDLPTSTFKYLRYQFQEFKSVRYCYLMKTIIRNVYFTFKSIGSPHNFSLIIVNVWHVTIACSRSLSWSRVDTTRFGLEKFLWSTGITPHIFKPSSVNVPVYNGSAKLIKNWGKGA